mmetsp:Transcript_104817/g.321051  ORF Transcript_104817/g.321051 Transcript_104817/m.321051 type:complete len:203 (+) Transcript_104817:2454-3062(+)
MNMRAIDTAVFAEVAAVSHALTATSVSSSGSSSTPIRKGPSASPVFPTASFTVWSFSAASFNNASKLTFSDDSLSEALSSPSRFSDVLARSSSAPSSASTGPLAPAFWPMSCRTTSPTDLPAFCSAWSAASKLSFDGPSVVISSVASSALSHSTSAGLSFAMTSWTRRWAACRCVKSSRAVFKGFSLVCASTSCACSLPSSA